MKIEINEKSIRKFFLCSIMLAIIIPCFHEGLKQHNDYSKIVLIKKMIDEHPGNKNPTLANDPDVLFGPKKDLVAKYENEKKIFFSKFKDKKYWFYFVLQIILYFIGFFISFYYSFTIKNDS